MRRFLTRGLRKLARMIDGEQPQPQPQQINIADGYVKWLCYLNAGMLDYGNLYCFDHAIKNLPPGGAPIVEIGSWCGLSANLMSYYKSRHGVTNRLFSCDPWHWGEGTLEDTAIPKARYTDLALETFKRNVGLFSDPDLPHSVKMLSQDFFAAWREGREVTDVFDRTVRLGGPVSFCFIDGNHDYDWVKRDFANCDEFLSAGGFILFDDSDERGEWQGVYRVVAEVAASGRYELVIRNPNYLFRKKGGRGA